ncbi:WYL domain-containing protein [uncultured Thiodictyon sp.]|uniref:helix-turn-helix transcriptional regulator n=1 Tax=uncultured Thiodictyon sp. TaxID=1846217 RepID=UPI0025F89D27|nr:WYL domain-containing protein [uncultured Thiodictyon sp.]
MVATHQIRLARLKRLETLLPRGWTPGDCPDGARLLESLGDAYAGPKPTAGRRKLQRDLEALVKTGRIEAVNPGGKPLRYRRLTDAPDEDQAIWEYNLQSMRDLVAEALPQHQLDRLWQRLLNNAEGLRLDEGRLRIVPDTLRLQPAALSAQVLEAVIEALAQRRALQVLYQNAEEERSDACLHPQALVQRGPIPYLFALKNDEEEPVRLYALHRMIRAEVLTQTPAREAVGFDLDQTIANGQVDFGRGEQIDLELRARGYLATVLIDCPLAAGQDWEEELPDSDFDIRVWAQVPQTGQLLRWLLGAGANVEVVAPPDLRRVVAVQAAKVAALYPE